MEWLLGCPVSDALMERWSALLVHEPEPVYLTHEARRLLPPDLPVMTRQEFGQQKVATLELKDSYQLYAISREVPWVILLDAAGWLRLAPGLRSSLRRLQWELGRGQIYQASWVDELLTPAERALAAPCLFPTPQGIYVALTHQLWSQLSEPTRRAWLLRYIAWRNEECRPAILTADDWLRIGEQVGPSVRRLAFTFPQKAGPNCFATAVAGLMPDLAMAENTADLWLHGGPFHKRLEALRLTNRQPFSPHDAAPPAGSVLLFEDAEGNPQHACLLLGDGLVLNKQSQSWHTPRLIWRLDDLLAAWAEDGCRLFLYTRG